MSKMIKFLTTLMFFGCNFDKDLHFVHYGGEDLILKKFYDRDGNIKEEETYLEIKPDSFLLHGFYKSYYQNGKLEYFANYNRNKKIGSVTKYYISGQIQEYWFYNPEGHALYTIQYDSLGVIIKEEGTEQRIPQIIIKYELGNRVTLKVYSAAIPKYYRNIYLISPTGIKLDSILNSKKPFELFKISVDSGYYKVKVNYYNIDLVTTDSINFKIMQ